MEETAFSGFRKILAVLWPKHVLMITTVTLCTWQSCTYYYEYIRHNIRQESPLSIYLRLVLHAYTRKRELVDTLSGLGISITYDRVLRISVELSNGVCQRFRTTNVVCSPKLRGKVFTTSVVDNIAAGTRMMVHAAAAMKSGHRKVLIRTVDTDVAMHKSCMLL